jgi:hypothetical protein
MTGPTRRTRALRFLRGLAVLSTLAVLTAALAPVAVSADEKAPSMSELKEFCRKLVRGGESRVYPFHVTRAEGVITFDSGDVVACSQSAALCSDPLGVLVRAQCRVELLKAHVDQEVAAGRPEAKPFWTASIAEAERLIAAALIPVRRERHSPGLLLRRAYMALWHVDEVFLLRLWKWANEIEATLQTLEEQGGEVADPCAPPPMPFAKLKATPAGATIHYMSAIDWDMGMLRKQDPSPGMEKSDEPYVELPKGVFVVKAVWPDGASIGPTRIRLDGEHNLIRPER